VYWVGGIPLSLHFGLRVFFKKAELCIGYDLVVFARSLVQYYFITMYFIEEFGPFCMQERQATSKI